MSHLRRFRNWWILFVLIFGLDAGLAVIGERAMFVLAAAVHGPIGLRTIVREMTAWRGRSLDLAAVLFALVILWLGLRAIAGII